MRWYTPVISKGDTRIIHRFLVFPHTIGNQTRWLEYVGIKQLYSSDTYTDDYGYESEHFHWEDISFVDPIPEK